MEIKEKRLTSPRGYVPILVGREENTEKILVHTSLFKHPLIKASLELASQEFGHDQQGVLQIPCDHIEWFRMALERKSKNKFSWCSLFWFFSLRRCLCADIKKHED